LSGVILARSNDQSFNVIAEYEKLRTTIPPKPRLARPELSGCETFKDENFRKSSLDLIDKANGIISEYREKQLRLTLRQLFYQFVAREIIENNQGRYDSLVNLVSRGRNSGRIPWDAIEDRTRYPRHYQTYSN
jgi:hypothetical protein